MSIEARLNDLFARWKVVQLEHEKALNMIDPKYFFLDGLVGDEAAWGSAPVRVLYVLKESNISEPPKDFDFWFKRIALDDTIDDRTYAIKKFIRLMQTELAGNGDLSAVAYMNLNKSGGGSKTIFRRLRTYATHPAVAPMIREQIEILAPCVIVCCGCYGLVSGILGKDSPYHLVNMWHPSARKSDETYMTRFKKQIGRQ